MADGENDEQCTYAQITRCHEEGLNGKSLRSCGQCGSEGLHHHMCAVSTPELEAKSRVPGASTETFCAVCAGVLTIDQVLLIGSDQAAAEFAAKELSEAQAQASVDKPVNAEDGSSAATQVPGIEAGDGAIQTAASSGSAQNVQAVDQGCKPADNISTPTPGVSSDLTLPAATDDAAADTVSVPKPDDTSDKPLEATAATCDAAVAPEPLADEANNGGNDGISTTELDGGANGEAAALTAEVDRTEAEGSKLVGLRVREVKGMYDEPRHGLIFMDNDKHFVVAFDDLSWRKYNGDDFLSEFMCVMDDTDVSGLAVHAVLLGRKGNLNLASAFLLNTSAAAAKTTPMGWECFAKYAPAPYGLCPMRFAEPPLDDPIAFETPLNVEPPFVSLDGAKVGIDPSATFTARAVGVLLGGTWNSTNQHIDKRRWVLVECAEHFYLVPLERVSVGAYVKFSVSSLTEDQCKEYMRKFALERSPGSINNLMQAARKGVVLRASLGVTAATPMVPEDASRPGLRPRNSLTQPIHLDRDQVPTTPWPPRGKYDLYKDPDLILPIGLKSYGPSKLRRLMSPVLRRALIAHGIDVPARGPLFTEAAVQLLLRATKKRAMPVNNVDGGFESLDVNGHDTDSHLADDKSSDVSSLASARGHGRQQRRTPGAGGRRGGAGARQGERGRGVAFAGDGASLDGNSESEGESLEVRRRLSKEKEVERARVGAADRALQEREAAVARKLAEAEELERQLLATKARIEAMEQAAVRTQQQLQQKMMAAERFAGEREASATDGQRQAEGIRPAQLAAGDWRNSDAFYRGGPIGALGSAGHSDARRHDGGAFYCNSDVGRRDGDYHGGAPHHNSNAGRGSGYYDDASQRCSGLHDGASNGNGYAGQHNGSYNGAAHRNFDSGAVRRHSDDGVFRRDNNVGTFQRNGDILAIRRHSEDVALQRDARRSLPADAHHYGDVLAGHNCQHTAKIPRQSCAADSTQYAACYGHASVSQTGTAPTLPHQHYQQQPVFAPPLPAHITEGMEMAALQTRVTARQREDEERLAALKFKA